MRLLFALLLTLIPASTAFPIFSNFTTQNIQCGIAKSGAENGYDAEYPWAVYIESKGYLSKNGTRMLQFCTGTIIGPQHVLTAVHCIKHDVKKMTVTVGVSDFESPEAKRYKVKNAVAHPNYLHKQHRRMFDVAVLTLEEPIQFNDRIGPICLDSIGVKYGEFAVAAGWGNVLSTDGYKGSDGLTTVLHQGKMQIVEYEECKKRGVVSFYLYLDICAKGVNAVVASGDSGGMLMVKRGGRWYQVGITSHGSCLTPGPVS